MTLSPDNFIPPLLLQCYYIFNVHPQQQYQPLGDALAAAAEQSSLVARAALLGAILSGELQVLSNFPGELATTLDEQPFIHRATYSQQILSMALVKQDDELVIKPEAVAPNVNYADWPLLLKNWDQRMSLHQSVIRSAVQLQSLRASTP